MILGYFYETIVTTFPAQKTRRASFNSAANRILDCNAEYEFPGWFSSKKKIFDLLNDGMASLLRVQVSETMIFNFKSAALQPPA